MNRVQQQPVEPDTPQDEQSKHDDLTDPLPPPRPRRSDEARPAEERHGGETPSGVSARQ